MKMVARTALLASVLAASSLVSPLARADSGSAAFDQYVHDLGQRMRQIDDTSYWVSSVVDQGAFERYLAATGEAARFQGSMQATMLADASGDPSLRTFNAYLRYLGQRIRADAGTPGPVIELDSGSALMDRYVEELNYRMQVLRQASDSTGF
jgi:hypothetical protein